MQPKIFVILPLLAILFSSIIVPYSFASVESEAQEDIQAGCRDGQTMVFRYSYHEYVCVDPDTADRWRELGLAKIISESEGPVEQDDPGYYAPENEAFPGAPPDPPERSSSLENSECRNGYVLVYRFIHHDTFCTSSSTANMWERLGLVEIIHDVEFKEIVNESEVEPEQSEVEPEQSEVEPEQSEVEPEQSEVEPEQSEVEPEQSEVEPEQSEVEPEQSEVEPEQSEVEPEQSNNISEFDLENDFNFPIIDQIHDNVWFITDFDNARSVVIEGSDGLIVINSLNSYESVKKIF